MSSDSVAVSKFKFRSSPCAVLVVVMATAFGCGGDSQFEPTAEIVEAHNRGVALMGQFDYAKAHDVFSKLATDHPDWMDIHIDLAIATLNRQHPGDNKVAATILDRLIEKRPDDLRALYCRAILHLYASQPEAALERFRQVAEADPKDAYAHYYTGQCLFQLSNYDEALACFERTQQIDPYLRSSYYGAFQAAQQSGKAEQAQQNLEKFQKLDSNPQARLAEIKYTRMGPKAEVGLARTVETATVARPQGNLFAKPLPLAIDSPASVEWTTVASGSDAESPTPNITVCDIDQNGELDFFVSGALSEPAGHNAVLLSVGAGYRLDLDHPLAKISAVNAALWGDIDNDGLVDVYLCRRGPNQLWRQTAAGEWLDTTATAGASAGDRESVDGACFDADHDGDLDLFVVNSDGPNELLNNNLDGTFRPLADTQEIAGDSASRGILVADLDADRDVDIVIINRQPPHEVYRNDRLWNYEPATGFDDFASAVIWSAVAADADTDGQIEIFTAGPDGITRWQRDQEKAVWSGSALTQDTTAVAIGPLAALDISGDGQTEVVTTTDSGWQVFSLDGKPLQSSTENSAVNWLLSASDASGYVLVVPQSGKPPVIYPAGDGRLPVTLLQFTGKDNQADQMRSNASGIGVEAAVRAGNRWSSVATFRSQSGPGQSLQPVVVGLGGAKKMDFVSIDWPDGVFQTEVGLAAGERHLIEETQRQVSSCPIVFAWNGTRFEFVTDILGVGGIGFNQGNGIYGTPRPWENLLLPNDLLKPRDDSFVIKVGEPMEEAMYLDEARLVAYDLPPGWSMTLDERMGIGGPATTGKPVFFREVNRPVKAIDQNGADVTASILAADGHAASPAPKDPRFIGRTEPHEIVVEFDRPLDTVAGQPILVFHGWIEYPYSQTMFAAWQAEASYDAPTLEALDENGQWQTVYEQFGYMAGMPRQASLPLTKQKLPAGVRKLRLRTNMEIYWDAIYVVSAEECPQAKRTELPLLQAIVMEVGFPHRTNHAQRRPDYDYSRRAPLWDTQHQKGFYTDFGAALELVASCDDALAIIGPGEEIELRFECDMNRSQSDAWTRYFVLKTRGWCKDRDLFTRDGETISPLPSSSGGENGKKSLLHRKYNRRLRSG